MKQLLIVLMIVTAFQAGAQNHKLWFKRPASNWNEALPVGNGRLGAMVFGGIQHERLQLNEESVWTRAGAVVDKKGGAKAIPTIRKMLFQGKYVEADKMCHEKLMGKRLPSGTNTYQTLGDLKIEFKGIQGAYNYERELQLENALVTSKFSARGVHYKRTVFSSAIDQAIVMLAEASKAGKISCKISLSRPSNSEKVSVVNNQLVMTDHVSNGKGVKLETRVRVIAQGGTIKVVGNTIEVDKADKLELRLVAGTDYFGEVPSAKCEKHMKLSANRSYDQIKKDHIADYQALYKRVELNLPKSESAKFATDERLSAQKRGAYDPSLVSMYFQFGRYLLIGSSREGCMPANLQGIWADGLKPAWNSDYHININMQMNYWPAEIANLSECHMPFLKFVGKLRENGRKTAKEVYGVNGFVAHHSTDAWHFTTCTGKTQWGMWPMGAAWTSTHIWEHYQFTGDKEFLKSYGYPVMREAALFMTEFMVKHPKTGKWVTGPSMSPENVYLTPDNKRASVSMGPAMDLQIVWHLYQSCIAASKELGIDAKFRKKLEAQLRNLTPVKISDDGRILEWSDENLREALPGHRHISHLYGLYPSNQYNWNTTPEYMQAANKVLEDRLSHGGGHTGWSRAWIINFYARLLDKEKVWENITALWAKSTMSNMLDNHPPFQIDGNFGGAAGIVEMLLQSHAGEVNLLPALPDQLPNGEVKGLMARGGHEVSIKWENGKLQQVQITSKLGNPCNVRYGAKVISFNIKKGETLTLNGNLQQM